MRQVVAHQYKSELVEEHLLWSGKYELGSR